MSRAFKVESIRERAAGEAKRKGHSEIRPAHLLAAIERLDPDGFGQLFGPGAPAKVEALLGPSGRDFGTPVEAAETTQLLAQAEAADGGLTLVDLLRPVLESTSEEGRGVEISAPVSESSGAALSGQAGILAAPSVEDLLAQLEVLVGLGPVKQQVVELIDLKRLNSIRLERGLPLFDEPNHLVFTGNPGTGKTTIARLIAQLYAALGVVSKGTFHEVSRPDLVGGYVGQTALKTREVVASSLGGVLFIDEAYGLTRFTGSNDYGIEAVDELAKLMEDHRDDFVLIVAGYPEEMQQFLNSNPGLRSRFGRVMNFPDYSTDELLSIFDSLCDASKLQATPDLTQAVRRLLESVPGGKGFGNGRFVREVFKHIVGRQAVRLSANPEPSDEDLRALVAEDLVLDVDRGSEAPVTGLYL